MKPITRVDVILHASFLLLDIDFLLLDLDFLPLDLDVRLCLKIDGTLFVALVEDVLHVTFILVRLTNGM